MKKYTQKILNEMSAEEVYDLLLNKEIKCFPNNFFSGEYGQVNAGKCLKYLLEDKLKLSKEDIPSVISSEFFKQYRLAGMLGLCFNYSPYKALNYIYEDVYKEWELGNVPRNFWDDEKSLEAINWLIDEKLKKGEDLSKEVFYNFGLKSLFIYKFKSSIKEVNKFIENKIDEHNKNVLSEAC